LLRTLRRRSQISQTVCIFSCRGAALPDFIPPRRIGNQEPELAGNAAACFRDVYLADSGRLAPIPCGGKSVRIGVWLRLPFIEEKRSLLEREIPRRAPTLITGG